MASELKVNTLTGISTAGSIAVTAEGNSTTTNLQQGLIKAWTFFDGSAGSLSAGDSFNESSLTDNAAGDYTFTITNAMNSTSYVNTGSAECEDNHVRGPIALGLRVEGSTAASTNTTTARRFECLYGASSSSNGGAIDTKQAMIQFTGDLA